MTLERGPPAPDRARPTSGCWRSATPPRIAGQQGRTERAYRIAPPAEPLFPRAYGELTNQLLALRAGRCRDRGVRAPPRRPHRRRPGAAGRQAQLRGQGRPSWPGSSTRTATWPRSSRSDGDGFRIVERNCAIFAVAREHPHALLDGAGVPPRRAPRGRHRARHPHDGRRPLVQPTRSAADPAQIVHPRASRHRSVPDRTPVGKPSDGSAAALVVGGLVGDLHVVGVALGRGRRW